MEATVDKCRTAVKASLRCLGDDLMTEDSDFVCEYILRRFFRLSLAVAAQASLEEVLTELESYIKNLYPVLITFLVMVDSAATPKSEVKA